MSERRNALADAAVHLVATKGMRGLTHRAVDAEAGVPPGTTSAYFRTRKALIEGMVGRLAELDHADTVDASIDPARPVAGIAAMLDRWLSTDRERTLARYACMLEATHHPELRGILRYGDFPREQSVRMFEATGSADPERDGANFVAFIEGLLFYRLVGGGTVVAPKPGTPESRADLERAVRGAFAGAGINGVPPAGVE